MSNDLPNVGTKNAPSMANYTLTIVADSGYESTTEGRCSAVQYGAAVFVLHNEGVDLVALTKERDELASRVAELEGELAVLEEVQWQDKQAALRDAPQQAEGWVLIATDAYEAGFGKGVQAAQRGIEIANPWGDEPGREGWALGYEMGKQRTSSAPQQAEPVHWRALLDPTPRPHELQTHHHVVGFTSYKACKAFVAGALDMNGWRYTIEPLYNHPLAAAVEPDERQPLTDEQIWASDEIMAANGTVTQLPMDELRAVVRAVEATQRRLLAARPLTASPTAPPASVCPRCGAQGVTLFSRAVDGDELETVHCGCLHAYASPNAPSTEEGSVVEPDELMKFARRWEMLAYMHTRGVPFSVYDHYIGNPERLDYAATLHREYLAGELARASKETK